MSACAQTWARAHERSAFDMGPLSLETRHARAVNMLAARRRMRATPKHSTNITKLLFHNGTVLVCLQHAAGEEEVTPGRHGMYCKWAQSSFVQNTLLT
jgi:hypothetical protein